jgi:hypothetical protein
MDMSPGDTTDPAVPADKVKKSASVFQCITVDPPCINRDRLMMQRNDDESRSAASKKHVEAFQFLLTE